MADVAELSELLPLKINGDVRIKKINGHVPNLSRQTNNLNQKPGKFNGQPKLKEFRDKSEYNHISGVQLRSYNKWSPSGNLKTIFILMILNFYLTLKRARSCACLERCLSLRRKNEKSAKA